MELFSVDSNIGITFLHAFPDPQTLRTCKKKKSEEIMRLSSCVPGTRQSGKWKTVSLRYACVKSLRRTFRDWAFASLSQSLWTRAYYDFCKTMNMPHSTILRNLGKKWARILFPVWIKEIPYDEALYIQSLKNHNVRWALAL